MNAATNEDVFQKKLSRVSLPGRSKAPTSKSDLIRKLGKRFTTGEIKKKIEEAGLKIHYSEIYGALGRSQSE